MKEDNTRVSIGGTEAVSLMLSAPLMAVSY